MKNSPLISMAILLAIISMANDALATPSNQDMSGEIYIGQAG